MKVFFDSNVHVSAAVFGGAAARAVDATIEARWRIYVCESVLAETPRVIREKLDGAEALANSTVQNLRRICRLVDEPATKHTVRNDPDDTPILRAAVGAGVDYLVTRDAELLALNPVEGVRIITLAEYLRVLQDHGHALD